MAGNKGSKRAFIHWLMPELVRRGERVTMKEFAWLLGQDKNTARVHYYILKRQGQVPEGLEFENEVSTGWMAQKEAQAVARALEPAGPDVDTRLDCEKAVEALECLSEFERTVIQRRYGLGGRLEHTLEEIGSQYGTTREWIRQVEERALAKLRKRVARGWM